MTEIGRFLRDASVDKHDRQPLDFGQTVTQGIVSATQRNRLGIATFEDFIQTDADINPGNSGGALVAATGQLIGINTAIISSSGGSQGIGLAIPIGLAMNVMRQLIDHGYVTRCWLGVELQIVPSDIAAAAELDEGGVLVAAMLNQGPAAQAGLRPGDIMISVNGALLRNPQQAINMIAQIQPGAAIEIELLRGWQRFVVEAEVAQRPPLALAQ